MVMSLRKFIMYTLYFSMNIFTTETGKPNIIFIVTDDQDILLDGLFPMQKTKAILMKQGATFSNMFVTTPLCCPSRASILTGSYVHNHGVVNNSLSGNCSSVMWQNTREQETFITYIKDMGYTTFYAGKYLNEYGSIHAGGAKHIPPGWDQWIGLVGNSRYYNYTLSFNGKARHYGDDPSKDYLTDVIFQNSIQFLDKTSEPFFMMLAPPAPHAPFTPAQSHARKFYNRSAPRTPNFNICNDKSKHWLLRQTPCPLPQDVLTKIDDVFRNRWRTLLSVDDGIESIFNQLLKRGILNNTYIFFSSDNGFHLGQFSLPWDKRQLYEPDVRVPLLVRGPLIDPGTVFEQPVLNIDLGPTFLSLAGACVPKSMDGVSFASLFNPISKNALIERNFIIEHKGEVTATTIQGCPQYKAGEVHTCEIDCICEDSWNNTYICIRTLSTQENTIYCIFRDKENFIEAYNISMDPFQMKNIYPFSNTHNIEKIRKLNVLNNYF